LWCEVTTSGRYLIISLTWSQFCLFLYLIYDLLTKRESLLMHVRPCTCSLCVDLNIYHIINTVHQWQEGVQDTDVSIKKDLKSELFWKHSDVSVVWDTLLYFLVIRLIMLKPLKEYNCTVLCLCCFKSLCYRNNIISVFTSSYLFCIWLRLVPGSDELVVKI